MKAYTDLEQQSSKLTGIMPLESADMCYYYKDDKPQLTPYSKHNNRYYVPCWSLAALLDYLSANFHIDIKYLDNQWELDCRVQVTYARELVDACYEMIIKLHEQKLL